MNSFPGDENVVKELTFEMRFARENSNDKGEKFKDFLTEEPTGVNTSI